MKKIYLFLLPVLAFCIIHPDSNAQTITVSGDIMTDTTWSADTVKVTGNITVPDDITLTINPGTYLEFQGYYSLNVKGRLLAVGDINDTIVFTVKDTTGFSNIDVDSGGWHGIRFDNVSSDNDTSKLVCCRIQYGKASGPADNGYDGGGIYIIQSSKVLISHCNIYNNIAKNCGGGIWIGNSDIILTHNLIHCNKAQASGGGVDVGNSKAIISNNIITKNTGRFGGGICTNWTRAVIDKNIICNNYSVLEGGGLCDGNSANTITCNLIVNNSADGIAGCAFLASNSEFHNNNVCNNSSPWNSGIGFRNFSNANLRNNIVWGNVNTGSGSDQFQIHIGSPSSNPDFYNCIIQEGKEGFYFATDVAYSGDTINIFDQNPEFTNPTAGAGHDFNGLSASWDIQNSSPCINHGSDVALGSLPTITDIAGNPRVIHGYIDIGAYEKRINKFQVSGIISEDTEWIADTIEITGDIKVADSMTLVIAPGTYLEFQDYYKMVVEGTLIAVGTEKDPIWFSINDTTGFANEFINDGGWRGISFNNSDIGANGRMSDNDTSKLIHCIIEYAKDYTSSNLQGGAIKANYFSNLVIKNCTIRYNSAYSGGGIGLMDGSNPLIEGNIIYKNSAINRGGGIYCEGRSEAKIINNLISNNTVIRDAEWPHGGGGISCNSSDPVIQNNIICNNESYAWGGGINLYNSYPLFANNSVCNNKDRSGWSPGGIMFQGCNPLIYNSILWGNMSGTDSLQIRKDNETGTEVNFYYCNIQKGPWWFKYKGKTIGLNEADPQFKSPSQGAGVEYDGLSAEWNLSEFSPNINAGMPDISELDLPETDIAGNKRINYGIVDIGAYESQASPVQITLQPVNRIGCLGDTVEFKVKTNVPATFQWQKNGLDIDAATDSLLIIDSITIEDEGNYSCIVANGYGEVQSNNVFLQVKLPPEILIQTRSQWIKKDAPMNLEVYTGGSPPLTFQWQKDGLDIPGEVTPEYKIPYPDYNHEGDYTCIISNSCGVAVTTPATLYIAPQICMVTVSTQTGNNLVIWEKNSIAPLSAYKIYRESTAAGIYDLMDMVPYSNLSIFEDSTADPTKRAYIYKITGVDTSGYETDLDLCNPHKTIHLLVSTNPELKSTQLAWDKYYGFDYQTYNIYRSSTGTNFTIIDAMPSSLNSWTDPEPITGELFYRVAVEKPSPCLPAGSGKKADSGPYSHSMSNMDDNRLQAGENPPDTIILTNDMINENNNYGMLIGRFNTHDQDSLDTHTYSLVGGDGDDDNIGFTILGDMLLAAEIFDYELKNVYSIRVRCTDKGNLTREEVFAIHVNDIIETGMIDNLSSNQIQVYPNPFNKSTTLMFNNPEGYLYKLYITDLSGKVCRIVDNINLSRYVLEKGDLKEGFYFIELRGTKVFRGKIVVE